MMLYSVMLRGYIADEKERYGYIAKNEAEHIITTIDCVMSRTNTLKTMIREYDGDTSWFDDVAEDLYTAVKDETGVSLKNFAVAPDGVVSDVYPLNGNESLIGFDFLDTSLTGNLEAKEAYENGSTILTNPFELIQGGIGMGGRAPVALRNGETGSFWGLVTVTIDFDNLIDVLGLDNLQGMGVDYSLSYIDPDGNEQFMHGVGELGKNTVKTQFNVRNLTWVIEVEPSKGWFSVWNITLALLIILLLSCFAGLLTYMMIQLRERNEILLSMSTTDSMTGCNNRRAYEEKILELSKNGVDKDFVYVSADVNGLKQVNDKLGHLAGDKLLSGTTFCMNTGFGPYGSVYRIGGDEFVALIHADDKTLAEIMEKEHTMVDGWKGYSVDQLSVSFGYASHSEFPEQTIGELIKTADKMMYAAKNEYYKTHDRRR